jgi:hypothetical protein
MVAAVGDVIDAVYNFKYAVIRLEDGRTTETCTSIVV